MFAAAEGIGYGAGMRLVALPLVVSLLGPLLLPALAGCPASGDDYPVVPGGPSHPSTPMVDAPPGDSAVTDGGAIAGRVCLTTDLRKPATGCAATGAAGISVVLGTAMTTTSADGSFTILPPQGTGLVWRVSGENLVPSVIPLTTSTILPIVSDQTYLDLSGGNSVIVNSGEGSIVLYVVAAGAPLPGTTVTSNPVASYPALGDRTTASNWVAGATGPLGVSWIPGIIAGPARLTVTPPPDADVISVDVPVVDGAITFATVVVP